MIIRDDVKPPIKELVMLRVDDPKTPLLATFRSEFTANREWLGVT